MDKLEQFLSWWLDKRPFFPPFVTPTVFDNNVFGVVLYRAAPWQVQLFTVKPNTIIAQHIHPNVDSFEVYVSGDIEFTLNGEVVTPIQDMSFTNTHPFFMKAIRVRPNDYHGGTFGKNGGCFLSVQHWLNGVTPTNVGDDWHQQDQSARNYDRV